MLGRTLNNAILSLPLILLTSQSAIVQDGTSEVGICASVTTLRRHHALLFSCRAAPIDDRVPYVECGRSDALTGAYTPHNRHKKSLQAK